MKKRKKKELPQLGAKTTSNPIERWAKGTSERKPDLPRSEGNQGFGSSWSQTSGAAKHVAGTNWKPLWASMSKKRMGWGGGGILHHALCTSWQVKEWVTGSGKERGEGVHRDRTEQRIG